MGLFDMPLQKLREYTGTNPCPEDFDEYWNRALDEMRSVDPKIELKESSFQVSFAECYDLYFTGVRGARIHAKYIKPKTEGKHPALIRFHGYSSNSGDWNDKLNYVAAGFTVVAMDVRGQGGQSQDVGGVTGNTLNGHIIRGLDDDADNMLFRHIFLDTAQLAGIVMNMPEVDEDRVGVMGPSQGGGLSLACAALEPRVRKVVSEYPFLSDYKRVWDLDLAKNAYQEITDYFRLFDPRHERENEVFTKLGYIDVKNLAKRIKGDVLMCVGLMDQVCPPSTVFAAYNNIQSKKDIKVYPDYGHEPMRGFGDLAMQFMLELYS
uniref:Xylan esterase 1 n=1 Tax=Thermoanaerobacterium saccharolyticum (strain DSM 8691 / JW/SL-YS485) TaxID=1094508 RepID=O30361_THESW|nr:xylan esterase 1 [Thermoanaerobacterium saccharolyticum JW/SL-YS485]